MRKEIVSAFKNDDRFQILFSEKLFSVILREEILKKGDPQEIDALKTFEDFYGYFKGYHESRKNLYSEEDINTAIANRIVNENFPKFIDNLKKYQVVCRDYPEQIKSAESALAE